MPRYAVRFLLVLSALLAGRAAADDAIRPDGRRFPGTLVVRPDGWLGVAVHNSTEVVPLAKLERVRLDGTAAEPTPTVVHVLRLAGNQRLSGELLAVDERQLRFRRDGRDWTLPRGAAAVLQPTGLFTYHVEDFARPSSNWLLGGGAALGPERRLVLGTAGQTAEYALPTPLEQGRVSFQLHRSEKGDGSWWVEAERRTRDGPRRRRFPLTDKTTPLTPGAHVFALRVGPNYLFGERDGTPHGEPDEAAPPGPLVKIRLGCEVTGGVVTVERIAFARPIDELPRPPGDPRQDEVWLRDGDQWFGRVRSVDGRQLEMEDGAGTRIILWTKVRGFFPRAESVETPAPPGERIRIAVRSVTGLDELEGVAHSLDERRLVLRHAVLGDVLLARSRIHHVRTAAGR